MRPAPLRVTLRMITLASIEHVLIVLAVAVAAGIVTGAVATAAAGF